MITSHVFDQAEQITCPPDNNPSQPGWGKGWVWNLLNDRDTNCNGSSDVPGYERSTTSGSAAGMSLTAGTHTLTFYGREVGARLDQITLTTNFSYNPLLSPTPGPCVVSFRCKNGGFFTYPCNAVPKRPCK